MEWWCPASLPAETCRTGVTARRLQRPARGAWRRWRRRSVSRRRGIERSRPGWLPGVEDEEACRDQADPGGGVVPAQMLAEVEEGEDSEDDQRNDLLDDLELDGRKAVGAHAVGRHLEAVFEEGDAPADQDDLPKRFLAEFQVAIPGEGHEDVGEDEQDNSPHGRIGCGWGGPGFSGSTMTALSENLERLEAAIAVACRTIGRRRGEGERSEERRVGK